VDTQRNITTTSKNSRPTTIGVAVGVPIGLIGIALLLYILRRYLRYRQSCTTTVYLPPDLIDPFATRIIPKIELDTTNAIHELDGTTAPSELEHSTSAVVDPKRPSSIVSELEGSPVTPSGPADRVSVATTPNQNRWSNTSSLAPPQGNRTVARPSIAETLSIVSQQHHGSGQDVFLTPPRPHASHRLSRPTSGLLPEIEGSEDEIPSTPKSSTLAETKKESDDIQKQHEGEKAIAVQETHDGEQVPVSETASTNAEAAQAGESLHERETTDEDKASRKSDTEAQAGEVMQDAEIISEVETDNEGEGPQEDCAKEQAGGDSMQAGEKPEKSETAYTIDTQTQSSK
jgi:hypothetical protein